MRIIPLLFPILSRQLWLGSAFIAVALAVLGQGFLDQTATAADARPDLFKPTEPTRAEAVLWLDEAAADQKFPIPQDPARMKAIRAATLAWYRKTTIEPFEKTPGAKAAWADKARAALKLRIDDLSEHHLSGHHDYAAEEPIYEAFRAAVDAGCDDPLVRYYWLRMKDVVGRIDRLEFVLEYPKIAEAVYQSHYPDVRKLYAAHSAYAFLRAYGRTIAEKKEREVWAQRFWEVFERCVADPDPFVQADVLEVTALHPTPRPADQSQSATAIYNEVWTHFPRTDKPKYSRLVFRGRYQVQQAWAKRGSGSGFSVTEEGGKLFHKWLEDAKATLAKAWELDPARPEAPTEMITVCMGLSSDRDEMEKWFARAMTANPDNREACSRKLEYLKPKWHGSTEDFLGFGWQCIQTRNTSGWLVWVPIQHQFSEAAVLGSRYEADPAGIRKYYANPIVWQQIETACKLLLLDRPDDMYIGSMLARMACLTGRYDIANRQFEKMGERFSTRVFDRGKEYESFRKSAKTKKPPKG